MTPAWLATPVILTILAIATVTDLRTRLVPAWLTFGGAAVGLIVASVFGWNALQSSIVGLVVGGLILLPFVLIGGFGLADALLLATIGAWCGWEFVLWTTWWTALAGAVLAIIARWRGRRTFPYVPAITIGVVLAIFSQQLLMITS
ncbi:prepilin peptidase [Nitrolancea hollandica]|uniref:Putative Peptidase A24A, prepilin type IV n=1 Tax=Nitrolancea hollandica Lb TaxID=1129897 RepID=I4EM55_9BACT|nr:A24 family peptidase [Nitrolancea hollandica]CCF85768.1 putative Peptidase A24A, prepilin type IV [Nitrolancea hollandica Lb]